MPDSSYDRAFSEDFPWKSLSVREKGLSLPRNGFPTPGNEKGMPCESATVPAAVSSGPFAGRLSRHSEPLVLGTGKALRSEQARRPALHPSEEDSFSDTFCGERRCRTSGRFIVRCRIGRRSRVRSEKGSFSECGGAEPALRVRFAEHMFNQNNKQ